MVSAKLRSIEKMNEENKREGRPTAARTAMRAMVESKQGCAVCGEAILLQPIAKSRSA